LADFIGILARGARIVFNTKNMGRRPGMIKTWKAAKWWVGSAE